MLELKIVIGTTRVKGILAHHKVKQTFHAFLKGRIEAAVTIVCIE